MIREDKTVKNNGQACQGRSAVRELGIYIHIPFCVRKCNYCDFLSLPAGADVIEDYIRVLCDEIRGFRHEYYCRIADAELRMNYQPVSFFL